MKTPLTLVALVACMATSAQAECYADYKAKQDDPLRLHYGVIELPDNACSDLKKAAKNIRPRLESEGWTLLKIQGIFDQTGLDERKESAGQFFLSF